MIISARNTLADENEKTLLSFPETAGASALRWQSPNPFQASWAVQIGPTGNNQSEIVLLGTATPAGTAGTLTSTTLYSHPTDTPVYAIKYDQVVFERSITGTIGTATPITGGTVGLQVNSQFTQFDDTTGSTSYAYRTYFRNSVLNVTSTESSWITYPGFSFYALGKLRQRVKDRLYDANFIPNDLMIDDWLNEWGQTMNNALVDINEDYALGTTSVAFTSNTELGTITDSNYKGQITRVWIVDASGTYPATKSDSISFLPNQTYTNYNPYYYMQGDSVLGRRPFDQAGTALIEYGKDQAILVEDADEIPVPMHGYTKAFVDYATAQARRKDNKPQEGDSLEQNAIAQLQLFKTNISSRLRSSQTMVQIVESTGNDTDGII